MIGKHTYKLLSIILDCNGATHCEDSKAILMQGVAVWLESERRHIQSNGQRDLSIALIRILSLGIKCDS